MPRISRWLVVGTLAAGLAGAACTGSDDDTGSSAGGDSGGGAGIPAAAEAESEAPGAPIDIPSFQVLGAPLEVALPEIEAGMSEACGGDLCVDIVTDPSDADPVSCRFVGTDPAAGGTVERGGTLVVLTDDCDDGEEGEGEGGSEVDPDEGGSGDGTDAGTDDGEEEPDDGSGDTTVPEDGTDGETP